MPSVIHVMMSAMAAAAGVVFNGYILFVFTWNRRVKTANRLLLFHLAFVDIVFSFTILFYNTSLSAVFSVTFPSLTPHDLFSNSKHIDLKHQVTSTRQLCQAQGFLWSVLPMVVIWNLCGLSFDRYAAISIPLHYSRLVNARRATYFVATTWVLGFLLSSPPLAGVCPHVFWDARWGCAADCIYTTPYYAPYAYVHTAIAIALPMALIVFCNLHMFVMTRSHRLGIASAICDMTNSAQATITHQRNPCHLSKFKGRNAFFTIAQVVGSLAVFTLPYYVVFVWETASGKQFGSASVSVATFLLTCTPSINAYVYGVKSRMLRQTVKRLLQRHLHNRDASNRNIKVRLSEIFTDQSQRPPLSRRLSAPADCCRKMRESTDSMIIPETVNSRGGNGKIHSQTTKVLFTRSTSLPFSIIPTSDSPNAIEIQLQPPEPLITKDTHPTKGDDWRPPLRKCESAPEKAGTAECEVHHLPPSGLARRNELRNKRLKSFVRSCSYPTDTVSCQTRHPDTLPTPVPQRKTIVRQHAVDGEFPDSNERVRTPVRCDDVILQEHVADSCV